MKVRVLLLMLLSFVFVGIRAQEQLKTDGDYYLIENETDYQTFVSMVNDANEGYFSGVETLPYTTLKAKLMADLTLSMDASKTIGHLDEGAVVFCGEFDGNYHTITMSMASGSKQIALFEVLGARSYDERERVKNLSIVVGLNGFGSSDFCMAPIAKYVLSENGDYDDLHTTVVHDISVTMNELTWVSQEEDSPSINGMIGSVGAAANSSLGNRSVMPGNLQMWGCLVNNATKNVVLPTSYFVGKTTSNSTTNITCSVAAYSSQSAPNEYTGEGDPEYPIVSYGAVVGENGIVLVDKNGDIDGYSVAKTLVGLSDQIVWGLDQNNSKQLPVIVSPDIDASDVRKLYRHGSGSDFVLNSTPCVYKNGICSETSGHVHYEKPSAGGDGILYIANEGQLVSWFTSDNSYKNFRIVRLAEKAEYDLTKVDGFDFPFAGQTLFDKEFDGNGSTIMFESVATQKDGKGTAGPRSFFVTLTDGSYVHDLTLDGWIAEDAKIKIEGIEDRAYGMLAQQARGSVKIERVNVMGEINVGSKVLGGMIGAFCQEDNAPSNSIEIRNCSSKVDIINKTNAEKVGGFVGYSYIYMPMTIENSYTRSGISIKEGATFGCFIGGIDTQIEAIGNDVTIKNCYAYYDWECLKFSDSDLLTVPSCIGSHTNFKASNVYVYNFNAGNNAYVEEQFKNGEIVYHLNGDEGPTENSVWKQDDEGFPAFEGNDVYRHGTRYSLNNHEYSDGICHGGDSEDCFEAPEYKDGVYKINNAGNLLWLNENWGKTERYSSIAFFADIDISQYEWHSNITPMGNVYGNGHVVKFMSSEKASKKQYVTGLFSGVGDIGQIDIRVSDLTIQTAALLEAEPNNDHGGDYGALFNRIATGSGKVEIDSVFVRNIVDGKEIFPINVTSYCVGGIVGTIERGKVNITNSIVDADIASIGDQGHVGGIVGYVSDVATLNMEGCASHGSIATKDCDIIGGLIGSMFGGGNIMNNYTTSKLVVNGSYSIVGSLIGETSNKFLAKNMFAYYARENEPMVVDEETEEVVKTKIPSVGGNEDYYETEEGKYEASYKNVYSAFETLSEHTDSVYMMVTRGGAAYRFSRTEKYVPVESYFSQEVGVDPCPILCIELAEGRSQKFVYPTCNRWVAMNDDEFTVENKRFVFNELSSDFDYTHIESDYSMHVCKHGGHVDPNYRVGEDQIIVSKKEDLVNMVDNLTVLTESSLPVKVTVAADIKYSDVEYSKLPVSEIQEVLPAKQSIGTEANPFVGTINGSGKELSNYAFSQNGLFGQVGKTIDPRATEDEQRKQMEENKNIKIEDFSIKGGLVFNDLEKSVKEKDKETGKDIYYAAALVNVNYAVIDGCSYVGALAVPERVEVENVRPCLVADNYGTVSHSFVYFTNLSELQSLQSDGNKAAILVKSNSGVGRNSGSSKKVAANTTSNYAVDDNGQSEESKEALAECSFSNAEFASGVVAYWLNFDGTGYTGNYTCKYAQDKLTPKLSDGTNALHRVVYASNNKSATISGQKAYANSGSVLDLTFGEPVTSVKINGEEALKVSDTNYKVTIPNVKDADVTVSIEYSSSATGLEVLNPEKTTVVAASGSIRIFGALGKNVTVYNLNGSVAYTSPLNSNVVELPGINRGIYFVKVGNTTTKVVL